MDSKRIVFLVGGAYHPAAEQARAICEWLGGAYAYSVCDGIDAFEELDAADLFVPMGSHFTGMTAPDAGGLTYRRPTPAHKAAFERYVMSGKPLLVHHGGIVSYDDWSRFGELLGFTWVRGVTSHPPIGTFDIEVLGTGHPVVAGVESYTLTDELYHDVQFTAGLGPTVHAQAHYNRRALPMVMTAEGGRVEGAGKVVYLVNGHDLRAFECRALRQLWLNAVRWLMA